MEKQEFVDATEQKRLNEAREAGIPWKKWGPYLSERQWGTVRDLILFYEYFHGDNGAGLGASHQTGWTGMVAPLLDIFGRLDPKTVLETERGRLTDRLTSEQVGGEKPRG